ncbi:MAG: hypothetical protein NXI01_06340 [Gammaproteobacteria bacterium]|nr:hypothetical protein [Gammaproteobacteria bacterium]
MEKYNLLMQSLPAHQLVADSKISTLLGHLAHLRVGGRLSPESLSALKDFIQAQIQVFRPEHQPSKQLLERRQSDAGTLYPIETPRHYKSGTCFNVRALFEIASTDDDSEEDANFWGIACNMESQLLQPEFGDEPEGDDPAVVASDWSDQQLPGDDSKNRGNVAPSTPGKEWRFLELGTLGEHNPEQKVGSPGSTLAGSEWCGPVDKTPKKVDKTPRPAHSDAKPQPQKTSVATALAWLLAGGVMTVSGMGMLKFNAELSLLVGVQVPPALLLGMALLGVVVASVGIYHLSTHCCTMFSKRSENRGADLEHGVELQGGVLRS